MLTAAADDLGGLRFLPVGGAGVANEVVVVVVGGGIADDEEGLTIFEWNRVWGRRIDPGTGILLLIVVLPIRGIREWEGSFDIFSSKLTPQLVTVTPVRLLLHSASSASRCSFSSRHLAHASNVTKQPPN